MARIDKYDPKSGGFRAAIAADTVKTDTVVGGAHPPIGVGLDVNGRVVPGVGHCGLLGVLCLTSDKKAGDIVDVMTDGDITEFGGVAGTAYYADPTTGAISAAAPAGSVAATLATGVVGNNNAITWTARDKGSVGNNYTVTMVDPPGNNAALGVVVNGNDITVNLATDGASAVTSTAAQVIAAIQASAAANALVTVANTGASTGAGVVTAVAQTHLADGDDAEGLRVGHTVEVGRLVVRARR